MQKKTYISRSVKETKEFAKRMGAASSAGQVYALTGDLGAGKTAFVQGFAEGLGTDEYVSSPTFTILQIYDTGRLPVYHFDVYRIEDPEEMEEVGLDEYLEGDGVCLIEWADRIEVLLPKNVIRVEIRRRSADLPEEREICIIQE